MIIFAVLSFLGLLERLNFELETWARVANVMQSRGKLDDAMELHRMALEIKKMTLGKDHSSVGDTYNNMADVMESQGKLDDAMVLYRMALEIKKKTLGEDHSSVAGINIQQYGECDGVARKAG
jgi:tetratricopeptide (TPR) repeat protein